MAFEGPRLTGPSEFMFSVRDRSWDFVEQHSHTRIVQMEQITHIPGQTRRLGLDLASSSPEWGCYELDTLVKTKGTASALGRRWTRAEETHNV